VEEQLKGKTEVGTLVEVHFSRYLNVNRDGDVVMSKGKSFYIHAAATEKARRPTVESLTAERNRLSRGKGPKSLSRRDVNGVL